MQIILEPKLALSYFNPDDQRFVQGPISEHRGRYVISLPTLYESWAVIRQSLESGSIVAIEKTDECLATQWFLIKNNVWAPWFESGRLRFISGGDAHITNLNTEHFMAATLGSQEPGAMKIQYSTQRPWTFLFTNKRIKEHRRYLITELNKKKLLDQALWSSLESQPCWMHSDFNRWYTEADIPVQQLPSGYDPEQLPPWHWGVVYPRQYQDTWFSLVAETVHEDPHSFRTEKTYKPIIAGHPFIISASQNFYRDLHHMGFGTFGRWIDESFDQKADGLTRLECIISEVSWLVKQDLRQFWDETRAICLYNQQRLLELHSTQQKTFNDQLVRFMHA